MALYTERKLSDFAGDWERLQREEMERKQREQEEAYNAAQRQAQRAQSNKRAGGLAGVLQGIGESIGNVGKALVTTFGRTGASARDLFTGNAGTSKYTKEFQQWEKKNLWGDENMSDKDLYNRTGGVALDAASTLSDLIPVVGQIGGTAAAAGKAAGKATLADKAVKLAQTPIFNMAQGGASGYAQEFIDNGENARLEGALKRAAVGTVVSGTGTFVGNKLAHRA
jgi:type II secretory pathway pseudopilin PulG